MTDEQVEKIIKSNMMLQMNLAGIRSDFEEASQRTWVGLTDEEIQRSYKLKCKEYGHWLDERTFLIACNWAETKLKDKNT
jgi:hypothetical protein